MNAVSKPIDRAGDVTTTATSMEPPSATKDDPFKDLQVMNLRDCVPTKPDFF